MAVNDPLPVSSYLSYLPAVLRQGPFLGRFLLAFEAVLSGVDANKLPQGAGSVPKALEQILEQISRYFDPATTDPEFLPWLAQWVATSLDEQWSPETKKKFLKNIVPIYRRRGTLAGLRKVLKFSGYPKDQVLVVDFFDGRDVPEETIHFGSGDKPAFFFGVILYTTGLSAEDIQARIHSVRAIVDREKPAHTYYGMRVLYPALRIHEDCVTSPYGVKLDATTPPVIGTGMA